MAIKVEISRENLKAKLFSEKSITHIESKKPSKKNVMELIVNIVR